MEIDFSYDPGQKFACRDCPSRCCKNWTVDITRSDLDRFQAEAWVQERLRETGTDFVRLGPDHYLLPVIELKRQMQCVFLEPDGLCGLHRRYGHDFLAPTCQTFPFDFIEAEKGEVIAVTSQVCPSIRDNYGVPLDEILEKKFQESGGVARKQSPFLLLGAVTKLNLAQYSAVFREWEKMIAGEKCLPLALAMCFRLTEELEKSFEGKAEINDSEFLPRLEEVRKDVVEWRPMLLAELIFEGGVYPRVAQVLLAFACLPLSYPLRSRVMFRGLQKAAFLKGVLDSLLKLLLVRGNIDVIYLGESIPLSQELWKTKAVEKDRWPVFGDYLLKMLTRRKFSMEPKNLGDILLIMATALGCYGFFAKLRAAGEGREKPDASDFKEALSAIEMSVLHQKAFLGGGGFHQAILGMLLKMPNTVPRLLTAEIPADDLKSASL